MPVRGCSSVAERRLPKPIMWVRFPSPAPFSFWATPKKKMDVLLLWESKPVIKCSGGAFYRAGILTQTEIVQLGEQTMRVDAQNRFPSPAQQWATPKKKMDVLLLWESKGSGVRPVDEKDAASPAFVKRRECERSERA